MSMAKLVVIAALLGGMIGGLLAQAIVLAIRWALGR